MRIIYEDPQTGQRLRWEVSTWAEAIDAASKLAFNKLPLLERLGLVIDEIVEDIIA